MSQKHQISLIRERQQKEAVEIPVDAEPRLARLSGIRAVVFDVYGTLFSSGVGDISLATEQNRDAALREALTAGGFSLDPGSRGIRLDECFLGIVRAQQASRRAEGIEYPEVDIRRVWSAFIGQVREQGLAAPPVEPDIDTLAVDYESRVNPTQAMPGLAETLGWLQQKDLPLSIISNAQFFTPLLFQAFLRKPLHACGFSEGCSVWSYLELEAKPSVRLYQKAALQLNREYGLKSSEVLYVGNDLRNDIWPARQCGFRTALFAGDRLSLRRRLDDPDCEGVEADLELTALIQLKQCLA